MSGFPPTALMTQDDPAVNAQFPPLWGIFAQDGTPLLAVEAMTVDSVAEVDYERGYEVSDYPIEQGGFESYNKVQNPFESQITFLSNQTRQQLLNVLEPLTQSLQLVTIVMPEISYPQPGSASPGANIVRYKFRRTNRNATLIPVDVWCREIRFTASSLTSSSTSAQSAGQSQTTGGNPSPVGQVNNGASLAPGSTQTSSSASTSTGGFNTVQSGNGPTQIPSGDSSALNTGSTNAAYPTNSGPVQPSAGSTPVTEPGIASGSEFNPGG